MEPKHKELLDQYHQNLLESITDADRVIELLGKAGTLSQLERFELDNNCSSSSEKTDLLLKMLMNKERDHFPDLCVALEKTHPHLYSALLMNGVGPVDSSSGSTYSILSTMPSDSESSGSLSSIGTTGKPSSPPPVLIENRQMSEKLETILFQLRQVTRERDELRKRLALSSPGTTFDDCRPNSKPSHDYEHLKMQCMKAMADLQSLQNQHTKTLKRCEEAVKEADFYHMLHSRLLSDQSQLKEEMDSMKKESSQLVREHNHLKQSCEELKRLHDEDQKEVTDLRIQQQQLLRENGSSEILNKLYDTAMDKLEGVKKDYDALRKRYNDKIANHNTDLCRLEQAEEDNRRLQKQLDIIMKQRDTAMHYQQQYSSSLRRFDSIQQELTKTTAQNKELQVEMERLQSEATRYKTLQLKAVKDAEKYKEERDSVFNEYRLIMSERDQVIKEVDKLQTELEAAEAKLKNTSCERKVASEEMEALRQELNSALVERDCAICERNELLEKYCQEVKDKTEAQKELDQACKDIETVKEERDVARKERTEAINQRDQLLREYYQVRQKQDSATMDMERANKEIEMLRKQYEAMAQEMKEALQEAEVAKCRRDWAFQERNKIVAERESIRTLCDNLRRERDRAVSDLAEALRNLDDMRKQKNDSVRELKEIKEKMENQLEKEARFRQLMAHNSHDSAIDTDSLEWETEVVEFEKDREDMDLKALGFDVAEGVNEPYVPGDSGIFVTKVDKGSIADGRLRVNDWLLKINDVDLVNKDRKQVIKAVLNGGGVINMVVRRRKSLGGRIVTPVHIPFVGHKDSGISLESGVFVAAIVPGSPSAREGSLSVGDRLVAINGIALDNKTLTECEALLQNCRDSLSLSLMKSSSRQNIFENLRDFEKTSNCRVHSSEVHVRNSRNLKHNSSTQTDIFNPDTVDGKEDRRDSEETSFCDHKPFSTLHTNSHRSIQHACHGNAGHSLGSRSATMFPDHGYGIVEAEKRQFNFDPTDADCIMIETTLEKGYGPKHSSGTWPKMMVDVSSETAQLSIFKIPEKQRKSVFDADTFKRPETPSKIDYLSPGQLPAHSPQASKVVIAATPPTPPARSDSFKFKHKPQTSSASDSTITTGSPPTSPAQSPVTMETKPELAHEGRDRNGNHYILEGSMDCNVISSRKSCDEDVGHQRVEEPEVKRPRPKSAPALRHKLTPLPMLVPTLQENCEPCQQSDSFGLHPKVQNYAKEEQQSPEPYEWVRYSPKRSHRHSMGFVPAVYNGAVSANTASRSLAPCPAVTAVMRNPIYTAWSHRVHSNNCPVATQICHQRSHPSFGLHPKVQNYAKEEQQSPEPYEWVRYSPKRSHRHSMGFVPAVYNGAVSANTASRSLAPCPAVTAVMRNPIYTAWSHRVHSNNFPVATQICHQRSHPSKKLNGTTMFFSTRAGSSNTLQYRTERIKIPSTPRYPRSMLGSDRGSLSHSECSSPSLITPPQSPLNLETSSFASSQSQSSISTLPRISISPLPMGEHRKDRPYLEEPRNVIVHKGAEPLGISIVGVENGGIFVSKVTSGSIAHQAGLEYGDQLLEYNGINLRSATEQQARLIIGQQCDTITILAQYNPHMYQLGNHSRSSSRLEPISNHSTPHGSGAATPDNHSTPHGSGAATPDNHSVIDTVSEQDEGTVTPPSKQTTPTTSPRNSIRMLMDATKKFPEPRTVIIRKTQVELGIQICGGNLYGIFVEKLEDDSPAKSPGGLMPGDMILENVPPDAISTDSIPFLEDCVSLAYQRVQKVECTSPRPVLILGPLVDAVKDMLVKDSPGKFCRCPLEVMKASQQAIERGVKDCLFIDYKRRSGHFDVTTVVSIKEITEKDCHCLLDIAPHAIERLHSVHIYPIVIFIRYKNAKQIKEQKDPIFLRDKVSQKHSKEQFEIAQKTEQEYSKFFTGT
ncbi:UNVERIFIED_CONTAM: hypothetical protein FKN15_046299 [Acipenser sinensis]